MHFKNEASAKAHNQLDCPMHRYRRHIYWYRQNCDQIFICEANFHRLFYI